MSSTLLINVNSAKVLSLMGDDSPVDSAEHSTETYGDYEERAYLSFMEDTTKSPPMSSIRTSLKFTGDSSGNSSGGVALTLNSAYQFINNCRLRVDYPRISVLPDYKNSIRIRAPHCLGLSHINQITMKIDDVSFKPVNQIGWLFTLQYCRPITDTVEDVRRGLGCIPRLEEWSTYIHSFKSRVRLPFEVGGAIQPIKLFGAQEVKFDLEFEREISKIYLMESLIDDVWTPIPFKYEYVTCSSNMLKLPELELTASVPSKHLRTVIPKEWEAGRIYYTTEIQTFQVLNDHEINRTLSFSIKTPNKILSIGCVARAISSKLRDQLNFTTQENVYAGYPVIETMSLNIDSERIISNTSESLNLHCQDIEFSYPFEKGFTMMAFGNSPRATEPGIRIGITNVEIIMDLTDGEIIENGPIEQEHPPFDRYIVTMVCRILRKYTITKINDKFVHQTVN